MEYIHSLRAIDTDKFNLTQEVQFSQFIMELLSFRFVFELIQSGKDHEFNISMKTKEGRLKNIGHDNFIYYIQVIIDRELTNYVLEINGKIIDTQIKKCLFLNSTSQVVPDKYKDNEDLFERYKFYQKHLHSYLLVTDDGSKEAKMIRKIYGCKYPDITEEKLDSIIQEYQEIISKCDFLIEIFESLVLVQNIRTLLNNMKIYLKSESLFS